jgi:purine-nucleoside phosphorylase
MGKLLARLDEAVEAVRKLRPAQPAVGVVLGSGLGAFGDSLENLLKVPYADVPHLPHASVPGHPGNLCLGRAGAVSVACLQGRAHMYEGHSAADAVFGVRLLARLGCKAVLLTNAAGGLRAELGPGDLMLIEDHLNLTGQNPLAGPNEDDLGPRFPDMTHTYDPSLRALAREAAAELEIPLRAGVYAALAGPSYETPAEIRMLRKLGADAVGMSTVPEMIALRHMRIPAAAISCITNMAAGLSGTELSHAEVEATAARTRDRFVQLLTGWVERVGSAPPPPVSIRGTR